MIVGVYENKDILYWEIEKNLLHIVKSMLNDNGLIVNLQK